MSVVFEPALSSSAAVPLIWAANDANTFAEHKLQGALALNMISGKAGTARLCMMTHTQY